MKPDRSNSLTRGDAFELFGRALDPAEPWIMGVLNVTPDSFSDGGRFLAPDDALKRGEKMLREGATLIDIGGESTRPGAAQVSSAREIERVIPIVQALVREFDALVSVDTSKPELMLAAADAGAAMINDVRALRLAGAGQAARDSGLPICIMHMQGEPDTMQADPQYADPVAEIKTFFVDRISELGRRGIDASRLIIDPGFGFGKNLEHNLQLLARLHEFQEIGRPVLVGMSRKSMLKTLTGRPVNERLAGSIALATLAAERGASIIRTHDVAATLDAVRVVAAVGSASL